MQSIDRSILGREWFGCVLFPLPMSRCYDTLLLFMGGGGGRGRGVRFAASYKAKHICSADTRLHWFVVRDARVGGC